MANISSIPSHTEVMDLGKIGTDHSRNVCRNYGPLDDTDWRRSLAVSFAEQGVLPAAEPFSIAPIPKDQQKSLLDLRTEVLEQCKGLAPIQFFAFGEKMMISGNDIYVAMLETLKAKPTHRRVSGYNRDYAVVLANALRLKKGLPAITAVNVVVFERELTEEEETDVNVMENTWKQGQALQWPQHLVIAKRKRKQLAPFSDIIRALNLDPQKDSAERGRISNLVQIHENYPEADIIGMFANGEITTPASKLAHSKTAGYARPNAKTKLWANGSPEKPSLEEVINFLKDPGTQPQTSGLTRKQKDAIPGTNKNPFVRMSFEVEKDASKVGKLAEMDEHAEWCDLGLKICGLGGRANLVKTLIAMHNDLWANQENTKK